MQRLIVNCDYCNALCENNQIGTLRLFLVQGIRNLDLREGKQKSYPSDICPDCAQKAAGALDCDLKVKDGQYYLVPRKKS